MRLTRKNLRELIIEEILRINESVTISQGGQELSASPGHEGIITITGDQGPISYRLLSDSPVGEVIIAVRDMEIDPQGYINITADAFKSMFGNLVKMGEDVLSGQPVRERGQRQIVQGYNTGRSFTMVDEVDQDKSVTFEKV
jgi:hypothetical protein